MNAPDMSGPEMVSLREYFERILEEHEKQLVLAAGTIEQRLRALNELREEVTKDRDRLVTKDQFAAAMDRLYKLEAFQSRVLGFGSALVVIAGIVGAVIGLFFKTK